MYLRYLLLYYISMYSACSIIPNKNSFSNVYNTFILFISGLEFPSVSFRRIPSIARILQQLQHQHLQAHAASVASAESN